VSDSLIFGSDGVWAGNVNNAEWMKLVCKRFANGGCDVYKELDQAEL
jgi:hypothetical protein